MHFNYPGNFFISMQTKKEKRPERWDLSVQTTKKTGTTDYRGKSNEDLWSFKYFTSGTLVIGGFSTGSDFMWDTNTNLGYQWTKSISTALGYRYLDVDYDKDGFIYDVGQDGSIPGLSWRF